MLPDSKISAHAKSARLELDEIHQLIAKITTGGFRIPLKGDPFWTKAQEFNKALKAIG